MTGFVWAKNADGIYYRSLDFCIVEDCLSTSGWAGKLPDVGRGGGTWFFECNDCGQRSYYGPSERERRTEAIFAAQREERKTTEWEVFSYGTIGVVRVGGVAFEAAVIGYHRNYQSGYGLNGIMRVRVRDRCTSGHAKDSIVDTGTVTFEPYRA